MVMNNTYEMKLSSLAAGLDGNYFPAGIDPLIRGLAYDSRNAGPGILFAALRGVHTDGHRFPAARARGAAALLVEDDASGIGLPWIRVKNARVALSRLSARFYDDPSRSLYVIGVTGTDGKSTTVSFIHQLLEMLGCAAGFLSTVAHQTADKVTDNPFRQSTPEAPEIHGLLAAMRDHGKRFAVVEATSHGLSEKTMRLADVFFDAAVLTNLAHEHLEFHGTFERYRDDKANLFRALGRDGAKSHGRQRIAVVNGDAVQREYFIQAARKTGTAVALYGLKNTAADWRAIDLRADASGTSFLVRCGGQEFPARLSMPGDFNVENFLAALAVVSAATARDPGETAALGARLRPVRGRQESIECGQPFRLFVDFAHTPQAFGRLLPALKQATAGRLIVVFGSAGERDTAKRRLQGEAAARTADIVILADEDPRGEEPLAILEEIAAGCEGKTQGEDLFLIPDRREAIGYACRLARSGDMVALLGKGHEKSIIYKASTLPWNERAVAEEVLAVLGFSKT
jgi:UDP-N-acetylmuramoyl-L-alanyl-D-glutamate--2,6-diaminopimelate ligase